MTMAPDPHAPHPCLAFDDPSLTIPPPPAGRMAVSPPEPPPSWEATPLGMIVSGVVFTASMAAILLAVFFLFGG